jgi:hypothetical protein
MRNLRILISRDQKRFMRRSFHDLFYNTIQKFFKRECDKQRKTSAIVAGLMTGTRELLNTKHVF